MLDAALKARCLGSIFGMGLQIILTILWIGANSKCTETKGTKMQDCKMFIMFTISVWRWSYVQLLYSPFSSVHFHLPTNILSVLCRFQLLGEFDLKDLNSFWFLQNITFSSRIKRAPKSLIVSFFFQIWNEAPVFPAQDPAQVIVNTPCLELACSWKTFL